MIVEDEFAKEPLVDLDLDAIRKRGHLIALIDNNSISYFIYKGRPMGYEYELLKRLTDNLKVDLKIKLVTGIEQSIDLLNKGEGGYTRFSADNHPGKNSLSCFYGHALQYAPGLGTKETG